MIIAIGNYTDWHRYCMCSLAQCLHTIELA